MPHGWQQHPGGNAHILGRPQAAFTPQGGDAGTPGCNRDISSRAAGLSILQTNHITLGFPQRLPPPQLQHPQPPTQTQALLSSSLCRNWVKPGPPSQRTRASRHRAFPRRQGSC